MDRPISIKVQKIESPDENRLSEMGKATWMAEATAYVTPIGGTEPVVATGVVTHTDRELAVIQAMTECESQANAILRASV